MGVAVAVNDQSLSSRLTQGLIESTAPFERIHLRRAIRRLAAVEAPLAAESLLEEVVDGLIGLGPLEVLLRDPGISDVLVNGPDEVFVERDGVLSPTDLTFPDDAAVVAAVERVIAPLGLRLDRSSPMVDARLPDGSRLHAVIPPAAVDHPVVAVRRFVRAVEPDPERPPSSTSSAQRSIRTRGW
jgi:Flp pilus assembly CpaF family ATPase